MQTIAEYWTDFSSIYVNAGASEQQLRVMKSCFYGGAAATLQGVSLHLDGQVPEEQAAEYMQGLGRECSAFAAEITNMFKEQPDA